MKGNRIALASARQEISGNKLVFVGQENQLILRQYDLLQAWKFLGPPAEASPKISGHTRGK